MMPFRFFASLLATLASLSLFAGEVFTRERAGTIWQDGLFIGDGATGAIGYAPAELEWTINRNDVLDSRVATCDYMPHADAMACVRTNAGHSVAFLSSVENPRTRMPVDMGDKLSLTLSAAQLRLRFWPGVGWAMPAVPATRQALDTRSGELVATQQTPFDTRRVTSFVERARDVMVLALDGENLTVWLDLMRPADVRLEGRAFAWTNEADVVAFTQALPGGETYAVALSSPARARCTGPAASIVLSGKRALFLAVRTTRDAPDPRRAAIAAVRAAARDGLARVQADHRAWWQRFWQRGARLTLPDHPALDTQWHYALYALAAQYGGVPMAGLNGLFYGPLGGSMGGVNYNCYVHDQNVQIPMMPFFPLGHPDFIEPFVKTYENARDALRRQTRRLFGVEGVYLPLNMNHFGVEHPIGDYRYTLCGGAYSGLVLAQAWWYTRDEHVLRRIYPLLKDFIGFYTATMTRDAAGTYHFIWSVPPEIFTGSRDDTATIACLKPCLETAVEAATRFGLDARACALWRDVLAHYPACARHSLGGWWAGPEIPDDHYMYGGHLFYPFFPAESDCDVATARKTLAYARDYGVEISYATPEPHPAHDWSALYLGMARMRLDGGAAGWRTLNDFYARFAKPNGHFSHNPIIVTDESREQIAARLAAAPKLVRRHANGRLGAWGRSGPNDLTYDADSKAVVAPVIEGGASFLLLASEALCQSWAGEIRLFPGVPPNFSGRFENFRVRGGHSVSAEMRKGRLVDLAITKRTPDAKLVVTCPTDAGFHAEDWLSRLGSNQN